MSVAVVGVEFRFRKSTEPMSETQMDLGFVREDVLVDDRPVGTVSRWPDTGWRAVSIVPNPKTGLPSVLPAPDGSDEFPTRQEAAQALWNH